MDKIFIKLLKIKTISQLEDYFKVKQYLQNRESCDVLARFLQQCLVKEYCLLLKEMKDKNN